MTGMPASAARRASIAVGRCNRPVAMTLAAAAQTLAPHPARKRLVSLRKIADGRSARGPGPLPGSGCPGSEPGSNPSGAATQLRQHGQMPPWRLRSTC